MRQPETTKAAILESVTRIVADDGADGLTIDEVAKRSEISKGGVLHHFPSKEALLVAAFARDLDLFEERVERLQQEDPATPGAYTRAYLRACVKAYESPNSDCVAFMHQFRAIPATVQVVQAYKERWRQRVEVDGLDPAIGHLVRYASDGIWLAATTGVKQPASFKSVIQRLLNLAQFPGGCWCRARGSGPRRPRQ